MFLFVCSYIKRETAVFFGVHEGTEDSERARWLERRKRLCTRKYGQLRSEFQPLCPSASAPSSTQVFYKKLLLHCHLLV